MIPSGSAWPEGAWRALVAAAPFGGPAPVPCAVAAVMDCEAKGERGRPMPEDLNLPTFVRMDVLGRAVAALDGARSAEVKAATRRDGRPVL
jgi:hypothetical protein